ITRKGFGYAPAENDDEDCLHSPAAFDPATGRPTAVSKRGWTDAFSEELVAIGAARPDVVAITAAMLYPTGLAAFARAYPDRCFDVGIAEQHAVTSAARLALGGPTGLRCPKGAAGPDIPAVAALGRMDVLYRPGGAGGTGTTDVLLLGAGPMAGVCVEAAGKLADQGIGVTVVDPRWLKPLDGALAEAAAGYRLVVTVEDNGRAGGFGDAVARLLRDAGVDTPVRTFGLPQEFLEHGKREEILA